jgi:AraC-like DNA-binding protein
VAESILKGKAETKQAFQLAEMLLLIYNTNKRYQPILNGQLFYALLTLLSGNLITQHEETPWENTESDKIENILSYLSMHAFNKAMVKLETMASHFSMSPHYISIYVKKHTGISIQNHVLQYKLKTAEKLLTKSNYNMNEIAQQLGFNDSSHLNKIFKKYKGVSPTKFKK